MIVDSSEHSYHTHPDRTFVHPSGWVPFGEPGKTKTREITAVPVHDIDTGTTAQCDDVTAELSGNRLGGRLLTYDELDEFAAMVDAGEALQIDPIFLPTAEQIAKMGKQQPGESDKAYNTRIRKDMSSLEWLRLHDELAWAEVLKLNWSALWAKPILNFGKLHIQGDRDGTAHIRGWRRRDGSWVQQGSRHGKGPHASRACRDYGTKFHLIRFI